jgi:hypothetical protein
MAESVLRYCFPRGLLLVLLERYFTSSSSGGIAHPQAAGPAFPPEVRACGGAGAHLGYNLLGASVEFNGVASTVVHNAGPNYVWATVPAGATTKASFTVQ